MRKCFRDEKVITFEHEYKYLGFWLNEYLDLEHVLLMF